MRFSISVEELNRLLQKENINIIDLRDKYQYQMEHIPGAISIPNRQLIMMPEEFLSKQKTYYLYCNYGVVSTKVCNALLDKGYRVINIDGGFSEYKSVNHN